jgi:uncharacterized membrane protein YgaE (UPF0421/DUF939 family)
MAQKFNIESYKTNINNQIADLTWRVEMMRKDRRSNFWEIQDLEDKIENLRLLIDPKFVCELCYSDRHAYQVIRMETEKRMVVRRLNPQRVNIGEYVMSDAQDYEFTENPDAPEITLRLHKDGFWYASNNCNPFRITSEPHEYFDYSF